MLNNFFEINILGTVQRIIIISVPYLLILIWDLKYCIQVQDTKFTTDIQRIDY